MKPPKINVEIEWTHHFQNKTFLVMTNEKSLYSSQNYVAKTISMPSNINNSVLLASDSNSSKWHCMDQHQVQLPPKQNSKIIDQFS